MNIKNIINTEKKEEEYTSKTKRKECKNENCKNPRAKGSSRCDKCKKK